MGFEMDWNCLNISFNDLFNMEIRIRTIKSNYQINIKVYIDNIYYIYNMAEKQKEETTTILVTRKLRDFLDKKGERNETFDDIIKRLVKFK